MLQNRLQIHCLDFNTTVSQEQHTLVNCMQVQVQVKVQVQLPMCTPWMHKAGKGIALFLLNLSSALAALPQQKGTAVPTE
jgi:hypothetical protein